MSQPDDFDQIFGYQGAAPAPDAALDGLRLIAPEIYVTRFWTPSFCDTVVRAAEAVGGFGPQPDDPVPGHEVSLAVINPGLFAAFEQDAGVRLWPRLRSVWPYIDYYGLRDAFVIKYALGEYEQMRIHHDVAQVSASIKLNDGFTGGTLSFPRQGVTNESVGVGDLIAWPSLVTHPHAGDPLLSGVKYALTVWFELPQI